MQDTHRRFLSGVAAVSGLIGFVGLALAQVFSRGVCCADDAHIAVAAKNLADGLGYATTMSQGPDKFTLVKFPPTVSTGPAVLLPVAFLIKIVGNTYWAPGLAFVSVWTFVLAAIGWKVRAFNAGFGFVLSTLTFLFLSYSLTTYHPEQWYALLGEIPSALWYLLGVVLLVEAQSHTGRVAAGIALALAVLSKLSALLAIGVLGAYLFAWRWNEHRHRRPQQSLASLAPFALAFLLPLGAFEVWRYVEAGNQREVWEHFNLYATTSRPTTSVLVLYDQSLAALVDRFRLFLPEMVFGFAIVWVLIRAHPTLARIYMVLVTAIAAHSFWWVFLSIGWPRYFIFAVPLIAAVFSLPFLLPSTQWRILAVYALLLAAWSSSGWSRLSTPFDKVSTFGGAPFVPTRETRALREVADLLTPVATSHGVIVTQWWATGIDIEYTLPSHQNFTHAKDLEAIGHNPFWVAVNTKFVDANDAAFRALLAVCVEKKTIEIYVVARCEPLVR